MENIVSIGFDALKIYCLLYCKFEQPVDHDRFSVFIGSLFELRREDHSARSRCGSTDCCRRCIRKFWEDKMIRLCPHCSGSTAKLEIEPEEKVSEDKLTDHWAGFLSVKAFTIITGVVVVSSTARNILQMKSFQSFTVQ